MLFPSGLVIFADEIARFDCGDAFAWITSLRRVADIDVPVQEADELVAKLAEDPCVPELSGIESLGWRYVDGVPRPMLRVELPTEEPSRGRADSPLRPVHSATATIRSAPKALSRCIASTRP